jgi:hypothetical protein
MRAVCHGLTDEMLAKLRSMVERARKQLLALEDENVRRGIVYLSRRIDSLAQRTRLETRLVSSAER